MARRARRHRVIAPASAIVGALVLLEIVRALGLGTVAALVLCWLVAVVAIAINGLVRNRRRPSG